MSVYPETQIECHACTAREGCFKPVPGRGKRDAEIILIGEFPDDISHVTGKAFDKNSSDGERVAWLCHQISLDPAEIYYLYAVGCHVPPHPGGRFRAPDPEWVLACRKWVADEIRACLAAYETRYPQAGYQQVLITLGSRPLLSLMGPGRWAPEDLIGHWFSSPLFPELSDGIFALPSFLTLKKEVRTSIIEEQWREALKKLWMGLGLMEKLNEPVVEIPMEDLPVCMGPRKQFWPCRCDGLLRRLRKKSRPVDTNVYRDAILTPNVSEL